MISDTPHNGIDQDDEQQMENRLRADGYDRPPPVGVSDAVRRIADALGPDEDPIRDMSVERARGEVSAAVADAVSQDRRRLRHANQRLAGAREEDVAEYLENLCVIVEQVVVVFLDEYRAGVDYVARACADIMQSGATTISAIRTLLQYGFVLDAEARWRGLHELACSAALLAQSPDSVAAAKRYLAHGRLLLPDDPAYSERFAQDPRFFDRNAEWLRADHPRPGPFQQWWIFVEARLTSAPFAEWIKPSHAVVHMSDVAVGIGREQAGAAPAGYNPQQSEDVAWRAACSLYEMVAHLCLMMAAGQRFPLETALAWSEAVRQAVQPGLPRWRESR